MLDLLKMTGNYSSYLSGETPWENGEEVHPASAFKWNAAIDGRAARRIQKAYARAAILGGRKSDFAFGRAELDRFTQAVVDALNGDALTPFWRCVILGVRLVR